VSRLVDALAADPARELKTIRAARAKAWERACSLAGEHAPGADGEPIGVDIDVTIAISRSRKVQASSTALTSAAANFSLSLTINAASPS
jgi:hypothetical protein